MQKSKHYERNIATLKALRDAGANLDKPHCLEHHLYCYSEASFDLIQRLARRLGFDVIHAGRDEPEEAQWSLDLATHCLPTLDAVERQAIMIEEIAAAAKADYDGWGTEVEQ